MNSQAGISLVEVIISLGITASIGVGMISMSSEYAESTRLDAAAEHMATISAASERYVRDHRTAIMSQASATTPALVSVQALVASGYLPSGFSSRNVMAHDVCALVFEPSVGDLSLLVVSEGGVTLSDVDLGDFISRLGAKGGGRFREDGANILGAGGAWRLSAAAYDNKANTSGKRCNDSAGAVRVQTGWPVIHNWISEQSTDNDRFIHRQANPDKPDASTMSTKLLMGGNRIKNLYSASVNSACGAGISNGELASDASGRVVSCVDGVWASAGNAYWGPVSATFSALPACNASKMGEARRILDIDSVAVCDGLKWDAALNDAGNLSLPRNLLAYGPVTLNSALDVYGNATFSGNVSLNQASTAQSTINAKMGLNVGAGHVIHNPASMSVESSGDLHLKRDTPGGQVVIGSGAGSAHLNAHGNVRSQTGIISNGRVTSNEEIKLNGIALEGGACSTLGMMARTSSGVLLYCENNIWQRHSIKPLHTQYFRGYASSWSKSTSGFNTNWCTNIAFDAGLGAFVSISLFGQAKCDTPSTCKLSARIRNETDTVSVNTREGPRNYKMAISTPYGEYASGYKTYRVCLTINGLSATAPEASYSISVLQ